MTTVAQQDITFERVTGNVGALVHGVELGATQPSTGKALRRALPEFGVLYFDFDHAVDEDEFQAFARLFGEPEQGYRLSDGKNRLIDADLVSMEGTRTNCWHTDGTVLECPPRAAILTPVELPDAGGDTMWASMHAAWEGLSSHYQRLLDGLEALHSTARLPFLEQNPTAVHPVVIRHPATGRKLLYVNSNYTERIVGMKDHESDALLQMLFHHVNTPEFHVRRPWRLGTVAVWDELATQHRGVNDFAGPRKLRRLTFPGEGLAA